MTQTQKSGVIFLTLRSMPSAPMGELPTPGSTGYSRTGMDQMAGGKFVYTSRENGRTSTCTN